MSRERSSRRFRHKFRLRAKQNVDTSSSKVEKVHPSQPIKVRKRGKQLAHLNANKRHKLRIQVKKLRYAAEFFSGLFQDKKAMRRQKKFMPALKRLQDGLGDLNDIAVDERLIANAAAPKRAFAAGLVTGREEARENEALSNALDGYTKLVKAKAFWR